MQCPLLTQSGHRISTGQPTVKFPDPHFSRNYGIVQLFRRVSIAHPNLEFMEELICLFWGLF
jgi:hypothetical protein